MSFSDLIIIIINCWLQIPAEVFKLVFKLAERFKTEEDRIWKLIVSLFIVEGYQSLQLGNILPKFEVYYGRKAKISGEFNFHLHFESDSVLQANFEI